MMKRYLCVLMGLLWTAGNCKEEMEIIPLEVISYELFLQKDPETLFKLETALHDHGIVGMKGIPGYREKAERLIDAFREFSKLPEEVKELCAPDRARGDLFLGYASGKEQFQRDDGRWVVDDLKVSYYAFVPDHPHNKWPNNLDLSAPYEEIGSLMVQAGKEILLAIGMIGDGLPVHFNNSSFVGRMLHYLKNEDSHYDNPQWCGDHFDHGVFTALLPAYYYIGEEPIEEPMEAGLFVKTPSDGKFKKVIANDKDVLLFQVGEFGQLATDDAILATQHRVNKAFGNVERFTMALFFNASSDTLLHSQSKLTQDSRYGGAKGDPCYYRDWEKATFERFIVK